MSIARRRFSNEPEIKLSEQGDTLQTDEGEQILDYTNKANGIISQTRDGNNASGVQSEMEIHCLKLLDGVWAGESALHLAIVNGDLPAVKYLVSKGADINHPTTQVFFKKDQERVTEDDTENEYKQYGYYGEYPLSFAAVFSHTEIYDFLLKNGANSDAEDSKGNSVLHMIVIHNQIEMFSYAMRHPFKRANPWTTNKEGLTPLSLCCKLGYDEMFNEIMELSRVEISRFSNLEKSLYPLASFDTIGTKGDTDKLSALMILVNGDKQGHLEMLRHTVVRQCIDFKWKYFVRKRFVLRLINFLIHILMLTITVYTRKPGLYPHQYREPVDGVRFCFECIFFIGSITTLMFHIHELKSDGMLVFMKHLINAPTKALLLPGVTFFICIIWVRIAMWSTDQSNHERLDHLLFWDESLLIASVLGNFPFLLFFLKSHNKFGPLIITLYTMVGKDVTKVMVIFAMFWAMYAVVFLYLFKDSGYNPLSTIDRSIMTVFHMSFGSFDYKHFELSKFPEATAVLFFSVMLVMPILLLNMLIATMANTFILVNNQALKEWWHQYAKAIITLERGHPPAALEKFQKMYTTEMSKHTYDCRYIKGKNRGYLQDMPDDYIIPGMEVTKINPHTRAFVRKRMLKNWKWLYGTLRSLLKAKRIELKTPQGTRVTFWDLFGDEDLLDSDYLREKMISDNLRKIGLNQLFKPSFERDDLLAVASKALSAKATVKAPATSKQEDSIREESIDDILNDDMV